MKTGFGMSFLRIVNEEGSNGWAQVYARVPFDDFELKEKGALFGAISGLPVEGWAEKMAEILNFTDEFFNKTETEGNLSELVKELREKYPDVDGVWLWVMADNQGKRNIKVSCWGNTGMVLKRKEKSFDFESFEDGKVIVGQVEDKDKLTIWTGVLKELLSKEVSAEESEQELVAEWSKKMMDDRIAGAGLVLKFEKMEVEETEAVSTVLNEPHKMTNEVLVNEGKTYVQNNETDSPRGEDAVRKDYGGLVGDTYVGPLGAKERIINWWKKIRPARSREIIIDRGVSKRKKWSVFLGLVFLLLLSISLITGFIKMNADRDLKKWKEFSEPIEKNRMEAVNLVKINPTGARKLMEEVKKTFDIRKSEFVKTKFSNEVSLLEKTINESWILTSGEKDSQFEEVVNISLVRQGFVGDRLSLVKESQFLTIDGKMGALVSLETKTKDIKVVAGKGEGQQWVDAVEDGTRDLIMNKTGIMSANKDDYLIRFDSAVNNPISLGKFGQNIYILDKGNREIYRYGAINEGFGERVRWLKQGQSILDDPIDMAIDADIWIAGESGQVEKYRRGAKENFSLNGLPENTKINKMSLELNGSRLAVLDKEHGYISICSKETGNCNQQLKSEKLKLASDIEFDATGVLWVLISGVVGVLK